MNKCLTMDDNNWWNKFFDNYFKIEVDDEQKWLDCKNQHLTKIFQYTRVKHAKTLILDDLMYLREIKDLNDPFEGDLLYDLDEFYNNPIKNPMLDKNDIKNNFYEANKYMKDLIYIACFSERNDITPMWHHYGGEHKGICVEYDFKNDKKYDKKLKQILFPIAYVTEKRNKEILPKIFDGADKGKLAIETFTNKSIEWEYEQEWRIIMLKNPGKLFEIKWYNNKPHIKFLTPKNVYLGYKIDERDAYFIKKLCELRNIPVYRMIKDNSSFNLTYIPYE